MPKLPKLKNKNLPLIFTDNTDWKSGHRATSPSSRGIGKATVSRELPDAAWFVTAFSGFLDSRLVSFAPLRGPRGSLGMTAIKNDSYENNLSGTISGSGNARSEAMVSIKKSNLQLVLIAAANFIGAYLSLKFLGGLLVFGTGGSFSDFCLVVMPVLALPIALVAWWNARLAVILWILGMLLFFGVQISLVWPDVHSVAKNGTRFLTFLAGCVLLVWVAILDVKSAKIAKNRRN